MEFTTRIGDIELQSPIMNAAGTCKYFDSNDEITVAELIQTPIGAIVVGSITTRPREVLQGTTYHSTDRYTLNALGLPNPGSEYYQEYLPAMAELAHSRDIKLIASVAGFSPSEYAQLTQLVLESGADAVELNLSCPNVRVSGAPLILPCFDVGLLGTILSSVSGVVRNDTHILLKTSPFSDYRQLEQFAALIHGVPFVRGVVCINTFPNALLLGENEDKPIITPHEGLAGLSGPSLKPIMLGQVKMLRAILPERISIIGVGGISNTQDAQDCLNVGASAVQIATALLQRGPRVFGKILQGL